MLKNKDFTEKGNVSVRCRNEVVKDFRDLVGKPLAENMEEYSNQEWVKEYTDEDGNILYAYLKLTVTAKLNNVRRDVTKREITIK